MEEFLHCFSSFWYVCVFWSFIIIISRQSIHTLSYRGGNHNLKSLWCKLKTLSIYDTCFEEDILHVKVEHYQSSLVMHFLFIYRCAGHAGNGLLHGHDGAHDPRGDVLCAAGPVPREPAPLPAGYPRAGIQLLQPFLCCILAFRVKRIETYYKSHTIQTIIPDPEAALPSISPALYFFSFFNFEITTIKLSFIERTGKKQPSFIIRNLGIIKKILILLYLYVSESCKCEI